MGLMNSHQLLPGARHKGGIRTYVLAGLVDKPTVTVSGSTVTIAGGTIEFEGRNFSTAGTLNLATDVGAANLVTGRDYIVSAVPKYMEPVDKATAEGLGLNYYVANSPNNEALIRYYIPSALLAAVRANGGIATLRVARGMGTATPEQMTLLNAYDEAEMKLTDPRFAGRLLDYVGVEYILTGTYNQDNSSKTDVTASMNEAQFKLFLATQSDVLAERKVPGTNAQAQTAYGNKLYKLKRAFGYTSLANATTDTNPVELRIRKGDTLSAPVKLDGTAAGTSHVAVYEYYCPSYMPYGHEGNEEGIYDFLTKELAPKLGRINPIYFDNAMDIARTGFGKGPLGAATPYADPQPLVKINVSIDATTSAITATKVSDVAQDLIGFDHINDPLV